MGLMGAFCSLGPIQSKRVGIKYKNKKKFNEKIYFLYYYPLWRGNNIFAHAYTHVHINTFSARESNYQGVTIMSCLSGSPKEFWAHFIRPNPIFGPLILSFGPCFLGPILYGPMMILGPFSGKSQTIGPLHKLSPWIKLSSPCSTNRFGSQHP